jgi:hypothetical protein
MTRTYSTSQVVRLLELHRDIEFLAPQTREHYEQRVRRNRGVAWVMVEQRESESSPWMPVVRGCIDLRSDWTRVKPAKVKRERVRIGEIPAGSLVSIRDRRACSAQESQVFHDSGWTLYAVKDGES